MLPILLERGGVFTNFINEKDYSILSNIDSEIICKSTDAWCVLSIRWNIETQL